MCSEVFNIIFLLLQIILKTTFGEQTFFHGSGKIFLKMKEEGPLIKRFQDHTLKLHASKASPIQKEGNFSSGRN